MRQAALPYWLGGVVYHRGYFYVCKHSPTTMPSSTAMPWRHHATLPERPPPICCRFAGVIGCLCRYEKFYTHISHQGGQIACSTQNYSSVNKRRLDAVSRVRHALLIGSLMLFMTLRPDHLQFYPPAMAGPEPRRSSRPFFSSKAPTIGWRAISKPTRVFVNHGRSPISFVDL